LDIGSLHMVIITIEFRFRLLHNVCSHRSYSSRI